MKIFLMNFIALETHKFFGNNEPRKKWKIKMNTRSKSGRLFNWSTFQQIESQVDQIQT